MDTHTKLQAAPLLQAVKFAGLTVRGFECLIGHRGSGTGVRAAFIHAGDAVAKQVMVTHLVGGSIAVTWVQEDEMQRVELAVRLSDEGDLAFSEPDVQPGAAAPSKDPVWR